MTSYSRLESGVGLHSNRRVAASSRVVWIDISFIMVFFVKCWKENIGKGCRAWSPDNMMYVCRGIIVPAWSFECFMTVHAFRKKIPSTLPSFKPL